MNKEYYIVVGDRRVGPLTYDGLRQHGIEPTTFVWTQGMADWTRAADVPELAPLLEQQTARSFSRTEHPGYSQQPPMPEYATGPNWKTLAIIATVCGFLFSCIGGLIGIFGILEANKAENAWRYGDEQGARNRWSNCKTLTIISFVVAALSLSLQVGLFATGGLAAFGIY